MRTVPIALVVCALTLVVARAQSTPQGQRPVFRGGTDLVVLNVSALDRNRRPVEDLTIKDFIVLEDGKPQQVVQFEAVVLPEALESAPVWTKTVASDVRSNATESERLFVMLIDDATIGSDLATMRSMREIAHSIIDKLGPLDTVSIVFPRDNRNTQDFTNDKATLHAAVEKLTVGFGGLAGTTNYYAWSAVKTLSQAAKFLIDLPDRQRGLIYIGSGVGVDASAIAVFHLATVGSSHSQEQGDIDLWRETQRVLTNAQMGGVHVYPFDAKGLGAGENPTTSWMQILANETGGKAIINTNDFEPGVRQVLRETRSYYLIGYRPDAPRSDGALHRLEVKVTRPDVDVVTRRFYESPDAKKATKTLSKGVPVPTTSALAGVLPKSDLPLRVTLAPFVTPGRRDATVAVILGVRAPNAALSGATTEKVELETRAYTPEGESRGATRQIASLKLRPGGDAENELAVLSSIALKPGRYSLRLSARADSVDKTGSVYADVEVPDFSKAPLSLSGIVIGATPGMIAAPKDALAKLVPIVPTVERAFSVSQKVEAFLRVYQGSKKPLPVQVAISIRDGRDVVVFEDRQSMGATTFTGALFSADCRFQIPIPRLSPGAHLLTVTATAGSRESSRSVHIAVK